MRRAILFVRLLGMFVVPMVPIFGVLGLLTLDGGLVRRVLWGDLIGLVLMAAFAWTESGRPETPAEISGRFLPAIPRRRTVDAPHLAAVPLRTIAGAASRALTDANVRCGGTAIVVTFPGTSWRHRGEVARVTRGKSSERTFRLSTRSRSVFPLLDEGHVALREDALVSFLEGRQPSTRVGC